MRTYDCEPTLTDSQVLEFCKKRLDKVTKDLVGTQKTLDNPKFIDRAPEAVVQQKRTRLAELESEREKLEANLQMLG